MEGFIKVSYFWNIMVNNQISNWIFFTLIIFVYYISFSTGLLLTFPIITITTLKLLHASLIVVISSRESITTTWRVQNQKLALTSQQYASTTL